MTASTEKLAIITAALKDVPKEVMLNVKSVEIEWKTIFDDSGRVEAIVPNLKIVMK